jgi:LysR family carnitine catabolism transcriptional activator
MRIPVDLRQLEAFVAVASCANFTQAALSLHVSQPALSRTIRMAEDALGARLFDRNTRTVELTAVGAELLVIARRILVDFDDSLGSLSQFIKGHRGQINVSALPSMGALLTSAISQFCVDRPDVGFMVRLEPDAGVQAALSQGLADIGITAQPAPEGEFRYQHLVDDDYLLLCRADDALAGKDVIRSAASWDVFQKHRYIASAKGTSIRTAADQVFTQLGLAVRPVHETTSLPMIGAFVAAGLGISVIPATAFALLDQRALVARPLKAPKVTRQIGIVTRSGHSLSSVALAFIDHLTKVVDAPGKL